MNERDPWRSVVEAIRVTAELTSTVMSEAAVKVMLADLSAYEPMAIMRALTRVRQECKGRLTIAEVVSRIDDGRPGGEEAWAMIPGDESGSCVWTSEMAAAYGVAAPLLREGDRIAARMAFKEAYTRLVTKSRADRVPVKWTPSLGHDASQRITAIEEAVRLGRLTADAVRPLLPAPLPDLPLLAEPAVPMPAHLRKQLEETKRKLAGLPAPKEDGA